VPSDDRYRLPRGNFERLIGNLAGNAITAVPEEGWVRIALRHSPVGLVLSVVDSGPGMPEEFIPVAFDRFSRPDESRAANGGGAGLGLSIVHAIVTAAEGTITLTNANGLGVTVEIPAIPAT
jgi:two-component system OmpR family sensor kinase